MHTSSIQQLKEYIKNKCGPFTIDDETVRNFFEEVIIQKKSDFLTSGNICKSEGFILSGCCKSYIVDNSGNEVILNISTENWWVSDLVSFQEQQPAQLNISALETTTLLTISYDKKEELLLTFPELERMFRILIQNHLVSFQQRVFNNFALSAEERYVLLQSKRPQLFQRIPQYLIASYLGITPEFLSRLRAKSAKI